MKTCSRCGESKDESEFYSHGHNRAGELKSDSRCKECRRAESRPGPPPTCRECGTKLRSEATTDLCGFCAPEPPSFEPVETPPPPSAAENRARIAGEQASESVMARGPTKKIRTSRRP